MYDNQTCSILETDQKLAGVDSTKPGSSVTVRFELGCVPQGRRDGFGERADDEGPGGRVGATRRQARAVRPARATADKPYLFGEEPIPNLVAYAERK